jgi:LPXTG-site transpeptidase (sortase) family protein
MMSFPTRRVVGSLGAIMFLIGMMVFTASLFNFFEQGDDSSRGRTAIVREIAPVTRPLPAIVAQRMVIESIGIDAPLRTYGLDGNAVPEVPTGGDAADVVAWYDFSATPGTGSNAVFSGHVTWFGEAVFWDLKKLQPGDTIKLVGEDGSELVYAVSDSFLVDPDDPDSVKVMSATATDVITLITCDGDYTDTGDPVFGGEYTDRRVVRADRI